MSKCANFSLCQSYLYLELLFLLHVYYTHGYILLSFDKIPVVQEHSKTMGSVLDLLMFNLISQISLS